MGLTTASAHLQTLRRGGLVTATETAPRSGTASRTDVAALLAQLRQVASAHLPDVVTARDRYLGPLTADDPASEEISRDELLRRARAGEVVVLDV
ncbi:hypothetical protein ACVGOW_13055 [Pseudonocardia saturnea]